MRQTQSLCLLSLTDCAEVSLQLFQLLLLHGIASGTRSSLDFLLLLLPRGFTTGLLQRQSIVAGVALEPRGLLRPSVAGGIETLVQYLLGRSNDAAGALTTLHFLLLLRPSVTVGAGSRRSRLILPIMSCTGTMRCPGGTTKPTYSAASPCTW